MGVKEIDAKIAALMIEREKELAIENDLKSQIHFEEAVKLYPELVEILRRLDEIGYMPPRLDKALRDDAGKFNPGMYIKRPRGAKQPD